MMISSIFHRTTNTLTFPLIFKQKTDVPRVSEVAKGSGNFLITQRSHKYISMCVKGLQASSLTARMIPGLRFIGRIALSADYESTIIVQDVQLYNRKVTEMGDLAGVHDTSYLEY